MRAVRDRAQLIIRRRQHCVYADFETRSPNGVHDTWVEYMDTCKVRIPLSVGTTLLKEFAA